MSYCKFDRVDSSRSEGFRNFLTTVFDAALLAVFVLCLISANGCKSKAATFNEKMQEARTYLDIAQRSGFKGTAFVHVRTVGGMYTATEFGLPADIYLFAGVDPESVATVFPPAAAGKDGSGSGSGEGGSVESGGGEGGSEGVSGADPGVGE